MSTYNLMSNLSPSIKYGSLRYSWTTYLFSSGLAGGFLPKLHLLGEWSKFLLKRNSSSSSSRVFVRYIPLPYDNWSGLTIIVKPSADCCFIFFEGILLCDAAPRCYEDGLSWRLLTSLCWKNYYNSLNSLGKIQVLGKKSYSAGNNLPIFFRFFARNVFLAIRNIAGKWLIFW